jgi:UDP-N-acetylmuramyl pentapeptide phosphotransferase/UDP-N-acetylglucosamine-1-phosphate transferase
MSIPICVILFLSSLILGSVGAWVIKEFAFKWDLVDNPEGRSSHDMPTPKGGAIGILAAFILASYVMKIPVIFWAPAAFLSLLSFFGDRFNLSPKLRLPLQLIAAFILLLSITDLWSLTSTLYFLFLVLVLTATANWYNFMDGINGIAGITGVAGFGMLGAYNILSAGDPHFSVLCLCIAFSCLGFLPFNMPGARVFMGDGGSILLGFVFAAMVALLSKSFLEFVCLASLLSTFYADEWVTMAVRVRDGENLLRPHRRHLYQLLANELGIEHWKISAGYGILQCVVGACVLSARPYGHPAVWTILVIFFSMFVLVNYVVRVRLINGRAKQLQSSAE